MDWLSNGWKDGLAVVLKFTVGCPPRKKKGERTVRWEATLTGKHLEKTNGSNVGFPQSLPTSEDRTWRPVVQPLSGEGHKKPKEGQKFRNWTDFNLYLMHYHFYQWLIITSTTMSIAEKMQRFNLALSGKRRVFHYFIAESKANHLPKDIMRSAAPLPCFFDIVKSQRIARQRPQQGTKSCRMGRNAVHKSIPWYVLASVHPFVRWFVRPPSGWPSDPAGWLSDPAG